MRGATPMAPGAWPVPPTRQPATVPPRSPRTPSGDARWDAGGAWCNGGPRENAGASRGRHSRPEPSPAACRTPACGDHNPGPGLDGSADPLSLTPPVSSPQTLAICRQESISSRCPAWERPSGSSPSRPPSAVAHHLARRRNGFHNLSSATGFHPPSAHLRAWPRCQGRSSSSPVVIAAPAPGRPPPPPWPLPWLQ